MSKFKIFVWIIILAFIAIIVIQNKTFLVDTTEVLGIDLYFTKHQSPALPVVIYCFATLVVGLFISYVFGLSNRFRAKKTIKGLTSTIDTQREELSTLKNEIESLKKEPPKPLPDIPEKKSETDGAAGIQPEKEPPGFQTPTDADSKQGPLTGRLTGDPTKNPNGPETKTDDEEKKAT